MVGFGSVKTIVLLAVVAAGIYASSSLTGNKAQLQALVQSALVYIEEQGDAALGCYWAFTIVGVVCLVPTTMMEVAGGFLFSKRYGIWTTWMVTCIGKLIANVISVFLARHLLKGFIYKSLVERSELLQMVSQAVKEEPYKMAFLVRGSMAPLSVKNYGLGVLDIGYVPIALCSCVFTPFYALQNLYLGSACSDLREVFSAKKPSGDAGGWQSHVKAAVPIIFNLLLAVALFRAVKAHLRKSKTAVEASLREKTQKKDE
jgi:uncharacterized membrane protein YdjX (TVP38/TMEM64 family)